MVIIINWYLKMTQKQTWSQMHLRKLQAITHICHGSVIINQCLLGKGERESERERVINFWRDNNEAKCVLPSAEMTGRVTHCNAMSVGRGGPNTKTVSKTWVKRQEPQPLFTAFRPFYYPFNRSVESVLFKKCQALTTTMHLIKIRQWLPLWEPESKCF